MKIFIILLALALTETMALADDVRVQGYWKDTNRDGIKDTYVQPYHRSSPNDTDRDNYGTRPNYNPYTGRQGTEQPTNKFDWQAR